MNDNFHRLLEILKHWRNRFPNIKSVSTTLTDKELHVRIEWNPVNGTEVYYTRTFPLKDLDFYYDFNSLENVMFDAIEAKYREWEVGEE